MTGVQTCALPIWLLFDKDGCLTIQEKAIEEKGEIIFKEPIYPAPSAHVWKSLAIAVSGSSNFFETSDLILPEIFIEKIKNPKDSLSIYINNHLSDNSKKFINKFNSNSLASINMKKLIINELNLILELKAIESEHIKNLSLRKKTSELINKPLNNEKIVLLNRMILEDAYPDELKKKSEQSSKFPNGSFQGILIGMILGIFIGFMEQTRYKKYVPSPTGIGISMIIPLSYSISIFVGSIIEYFLTRRKPENREITGSIAAGAIAGEPIVGTLSHLLL